MNKFFTKIAGLVLGLTLAVGVGAAVSQGIKASEVGAATWTRCTKVTDLTSGGTFILGYEATAKSGTIIPMQNGGSATTSAAGYINSGSTSGKSENTTISMSSLSSSTLYEVTMKASTAVSGAVNILLGDNYLGNTNTKNNCKLFDSDSATTAFTPTVGTNDVFTLKISANVAYHTLQYNTGSPRFAVYGGTQKNVVIYKKVTATLTSVAVSGTPTKTTYEEGDSLDPTGLIVTGTYSDSSEEVITEGISWSYNPATLSKGDVSCDVVATVSSISSEAYTVNGLTVTGARTVSSIELNGSLNKTTYYVGDDWDLTGLDIKVIWSEGEPSYVELADATSVTKNPETPSDTAINQLTVTVNYAEKQASKSYDVTVMAGAIYSKTFADLTNGDEWKTNTYERDLVKTDSDGKSWRMSASGKYNSNYLFGDYLSAASSLGKYVTTSSNYYGKIASAMTLGTYNYAMYTKNFTIQSLKRVSVNWTAYNTTQGTQIMYILGSNNGGSSFEKLGEIDWSAQLNNTPCSIDWSNPTKYSTSDNVIVAIAYSSSYAKPEPQNFSISLFGDSIEEATWLVRKVDVSGDNNVEVGGDTTFSATVNDGYEPAAVSDVTWSSSDENIATVNSSTGVVTGVAVGSTTITATATDGTGVTGTKNINVVAATIHVESVQISDSEKTLEQHDEYQLSANVLPSDATEKGITWSSNNESVATVDQTGLVTAVAGGSATITATSVDGGKTATCSVTVNAYVGDFEKVTSESQLFEGAKVMFANSNNNAVCGEFNIGSSNYFTKADGTFSDDKNSVSSEDGLVFTIRKYGDNYAFEYEYEKSNYFISSDSATMSLKSSYSNVVAWSLSFESAFSMKGKTNSSVELKYNSTDPRFKNYTSKQSAIQLYIESSSATPTDANIVDTFVNTELHMRDYIESLGYCKDSENHYYSTAKEKYNSLSADQKTLFTTDESYEAARARLQAWAVANGETFDASGNLVTNSYTSLLNFNDNNSSIIVIVVISLVSLTAIGGYFFIRRRKETH